MHSTNAIVDQPLRVATAWCRMPGKGRGIRRVVAYARAQYFHGAFKTDLDARSSVVHEYEPGVEWNVKDRIRADGRLCDLGQALPGQCGA